MGQAVDFLRQQAAEILPPDFRYDFLSQSRQYVQEGNQLTVTFAFALIIIFLVLAAQFESLRDPLVILVCVPMSICGALLPLFIGFAHPQHLHPDRPRDADRPDQQARHPDGRVRQRAAARRGPRPARGDRGGGEGPAAPDPDDDGRDGGRADPAPHRLGAGAASRFSIGLVIVAGMSIGTLFTLFVLPTVYTLLASDHRPARQAQREAELRSVTPEPA